MRCCSTTKTILQHKSLCQSDCNSKCMKSQNLSPCQAQQTQLKTPQINVACIHCDCLGSVSKAQQYLAPSQQSAIALGLHCHPGCHGVPKGSVGGCAGVVGYSASPAEKLVPTKLTRACRHQTALHNLHCGFVDQGLTTQESEFAKNTCDRLYIHI